MSGNPETHCIRIHKYGNRRLYRMDESRYMTLEEVGDLVRDHRDFLVQDARTGEDLTGLVLAQVILHEQKSTSGQAFSTEFLLDVIRHNSLADVNS